MISGFVVTGSLLGGAPAENACDYFAQFYARRLKRLTVALCLFVAVSAGLMPLVMGNSARMESLQEYYTSAMLATFGGANIYYATLEDDYWSQTDGGRDENPFLHCWSLGAASGSEASRPSPPPGAGRRRMPGSLC